MLAFLAVMTWHAALVCALLLTRAAPNEPPARDAGIPVASLAFLEGRVEQARGPTRWDRIEEGARIRTGDRIRTTDGALARVEFPWMNLLVSPSSVVSIPPSRILSTVLEAGRVEQIAPGGDIIKLRTAEASVRGGGRVVVRHEGETTWVAVIEGRFRVDAAGKTAALTTGQGVTIAAGGPPSPPTSLPEPPTELRPGADPAYVLEGQPASLGWKGEAPSYHVQVLALDVDVVLVERDVAAPKASLAIPRVGTYRWRAASRDAKGFEGPPSAEGLVCVVEK